MNSTINTPNWPRSQADQRILNNLRQGINHDKFEEDYQLECQSWYPS